MARMGRDPLYVLRSPRDRVRRCDAIRLTPYGATLRAGKNATSKRTRRVMIENFYLRAQIDRLHLRKQFLSIGRVREIALRMTDRYDRNVADVRG